MTSEQDSGNVGNSESSPVMPSHFEVHPDNMPLFYLLIGTCVAGWVLTTIVQITDNYSDQNSLAMASVWPGVVVFTVAAQRMYRAGSVSFTDTTIAISGLFRSRREYRLADIESVSFVTQQYYIRGTRTVESITFQMRDKDNTRKSPVIIATPYSQSAIGAVLTRLRQAGVQLDETLALRADRFSGSIQTASRLVRMSGRYALAVAAALFCVSGAISVIKARVAPDSLESQISEFVQSKVIASEGPYGVEEIECGYVFAPGDLRGCEVVLSPTEPTSTGRNREAVIWYRENWLGYDVIDEMTAAVLVDDVVKSIEEQTGADDALCYTVDVPSDEKIPDGALQSDFFNVGASGSTNIVCELTDYEIDEATTEQFAILRADGSVEISR